MKRHLWGKFFIQEEDGPNFPEFQQILAETEQRIYLLIKARWVFIAILIFYSLFAVAFYKITGLFHIVKEIYLVPAISFLIMIAYNSGYTFSYKWFNRIRGINQLQLIFDTFFITILIHYSGGLLSWVWALYPLLIIEAALLFESKNDTLGITLLCILLYGGLLLLEHHGIITPIKVPVLYEIRQDPSYTLLFVSWFTFIVLVFAIIGTYLMGMVREEEAELKRQVVIDGLTKLYNRSYFFHRLHSEIARSRRFGHMASVLLIDLDGFKTINDTFGHLAGDDLLKKVAEVFKDNIRRSATIPAYDVDVPCRYGGDEFAIILPETGAEAAVTAADRIRQSIVTQCNGFADKYSKDKNLDEQQLPGVTLSVGIATYPLHGYMPDELIKKADDALYKAKSAGRNTVVQAEPMESPAAAS